jgi:hypothetical protein
VTRGKGGWGAVLPILQSNKLTESKISNKIDELPNYFFLGQCRKPFDHTRKQHNEKRSVLILSGKRLLFDSGKRGLLIAPKWIL